MSTSDSRFQPLSEPEPEPETQPPEVVAHLSHDGVHLIVKCCPHCRRQHLHGAGKDPRNPLYGHRVGHCRGIDQPGYILVPPGASVNTPASTSPPPEHILQFFACDHLPPHLATVSRPFCELAYALVYGDNGPETGHLTFGGPLPRNPERTVALRKLLEAKDAAVRALIALD